MGSRLLAACASIAFGCVCAQAQTIVVSDDTFEEDDWVHQILMSEGDIQLGPFTQEVIGGNPGAFQKGHHITDGPFATIYGGHLYLPAEYSPSTQGEIESIDISFDWIDLDAGGVQQGLFITQGSSTYIRFVSIDDWLPIWTTLSVDGITGDDPLWERITAGGKFNQPPDYSENGEDIRVGYYTFNWSLPQGIFVERTWGIDNFKVTIHSLGCEPDCNGDGTLNILDFVCFQQAWVANEPFGDCDGNGAFNVLDFVCFQLLFVEGCGG